MKNLAHKRILVTRPQHQAAALAEAITQHAGRCVLLPCIEIIPLHYTRDIIAAEHMDVCIVTSVNAVHDRSYLALQPVATRIAIGPATAAALNALNLSCITPDVYSSDGILALPQMHTVQGKNIAIYTGEHPNPSLQRVLQQRGAHTQLVLCYKRQCPHYSEQDLERIIHTSCDFIIAGSRDALENLTTLFKTRHDWLMRQTLIVISDALFSTAKTLGFTHIHRAANASTAAIIECLLAIIP